MCHPYQTLGLSSSDECFHTTESWRRCSVVCQILHLCLDNQCSMWNPAGPQTVGVETMSSLWTYMVDSVPLLPEMSV